MFVRCALALAWLGVAGCGAIDRLLEGGGIPGRLSIAVVPSSVSLVPGRQQSLAVSVSKTGDVRGQVTLEVEDTPQGVDASVSIQSDTRDAASGTIHLRVDAGTLPGNHVLRIRGRAQGTPDAAALLVLFIVEPPGVELTASKDALSIARGGVHPLTLRVARTAFDSPLTLSLQAAAGITAAFGSNPLLGDSTTVTLAVAGDVQPGTYPVSLRATGPDLPEAAVPISVTVTTDPIQLVLVEEELQAPQGSTAAAEILVNRGGFAGPVTLSAEGLPPGITAAFQPDAPTGTSSTMTLTLGPGTLPGTHAGTVRGSGGAGGPVTTAAFRLHVSPAGITAALSPALVGLFPGVTATATLSVTRMDYEGPVLVGIEGAPAGLTVTPLPVVMTGTTAVLTVGATGELNPGTYDVTVRATPEAIGPAASQTVTLRVTVLGGPGSGNVVLDWSTCPAPIWVAMRDGEGPWTQVPLVEGAAHFTVSSDQGALAFVASAGSVVVRFLTREELTAAPIAMCPPVPGAKRVFGVGVHSSAGSAEQWHYRLGGGTGISSAASPNVTINGVSEGIHDLVVWGFSVLQQSIRVLILRDRQIPDGGSFGQVELGSAEAHSVVSANLEVTLGDGQPVTGTVTMSGSMHYLTGEACTVNHLNDQTGLVGVPEGAQRPTDFHMKAVRRSSSAGQYEVTDVFHRLAGRTMEVPAAFASPVLTRLPGDYLRLSAALGQVPAAYDDAATFSYQSGSWTITLIASMGVAGAGGVVLEMPDFSQVGGWLDTFAPPAGAAGSWTMRLEGGGVNESPCREGKRLVRGSRVGSF